MMTLQQRINRDGITARAEWADGNPNMSDMPAGSSHWRVTLRRKGKQLTVPFSQGPAHSHEPAAIDVLSCLISDASGAEQRFEDWADDLGFDTDSRKAERIYNAVQKQTAKLRRFLGADFDAYLYETEAY